MNLTSSSLKNPYTVIALVLVVAALGVFSFFGTPTDLFPNTVPPQVVVVTVQPGAAARDVTDKITRVIEKELNTLGGLKRVTSTSRDEVSSINAEFLYTKSVNEALVDVQNALGRIRPDLPADILEPRLYKITDATRPLLTIAARPAEGSLKTLSEIRLLAENQIEDALLELDGIADVDVFGAHRPEVRVNILRDRLAANRITLQEVIGALAAQNVSAPAGTVYTTAGEYLVRTTGEFKTLQEIRDLPVRQAEGGFLRIRDLGTVALEEREQRSVYHGNGKSAIAINLLRPENGPTVAAIGSVKGFLPELAATYPDVTFEITDDQQPIIDVNVHGMRTSLLQAVLLTIAVIFLFLADTRAAIVVSVSIPLAFLASLTVLWFSPYTLNMVTLSGLIISVGMVVDASIVVLENIYRHYREMKVPDAREAARRGTNEVALAITAGMFTTVIVLVPVMFAGGYTQQVMRPLTMMISATLVASLLVALTVIPLVAARVLRRDHSKRSVVERMFGFTDRGVAVLARFYVFVLRGALRRRTFTLLLAAAFFVVSMKVVPPLIGGELMPPMDTGIVLLELDTPTGYSPRQLEEVLWRVETMVYEQPGVEMVSAVVGSEPGEISFGGGGATAQSAKLTIHLVDRMHRDETIWEIEGSWRERLRSMPGVRTFRVSEYGATPLSTTKAPLDVLISGEDSGVLSKLADQSIEALRGIPGLVDVRRSWYIDKVEQNVTFDPSLVQLYGTSPREATRELAAAVKGVPATQMRLAGYLDIPLTVKYAQSDMAAVGDIESAYVGTRFGPVPVRAMASVRSSIDQPFLTREQLHNTIDVTGVNYQYTIAQVGEMAKKRLTAIQPPAGYSIQVSGTVADMKAGKAEMGGALKIGVVLLYFLLLAMFRSFRHPVTIMAAIPLAIAGAMWGLLLFDKPMCKPATMGLILLGGTIVNNSILLLDFILAARARGVGRDEAILEAVRLRIRPILMTTVSTIVGLMPLMLELAVGLERMSPLGVVAATGLLVGTFMTLVVIPTLYSGMDSLALGAGRFSRFLQGGQPTTT